MSNDTSKVHAPWGYEFLTTQQEVQTTWIYQIVETVVLYVSLQFPWKLTDNFLANTMYRGGYLWEYVATQCLNHF
jgi:hypothetical protein